MVLEPFLKKPKYDLALNIKEFRFEDILREFEQDSVIEGSVNLNTHLTIEKQKDLNWIQSLNGDLSLEGKDLELNGMNLDELLHKFERSQNFNLVDLGAVAFAGPLGLGLTKGTDFANIMISNNGDSTYISHLISDWDIDSGKLNIADVAFATEEYRVIGLGTFDLNTNYLDFKIAAVQEKGCEVFSQTIVGSADSVEYGKVKIMKAIVAPVTNLFEDSFTKCDPIYSGRVEHPIKTKEKK